MSCREIPQPPAAVRPGHAAAADALADRLEEGARALAALASALTDAEWQTRIPKDGRTVGVVVHHVASVYPLEIQLAQTLARGQPVAGVTMGDVHEMNAGHAREHEAVTKEAAIDLLLERNSAAAAAAIRALSDEELDRAAPGLAQRRCPADLPVRPRGSRRPAQLSPPRADPRSVEAGLTSGRPAGLTAR